MEHIRRVFGNNFAYFSIKKYVVGTHKNRLGEAFLMSTHNICFYGEQKKIAFELSPNTLLIWPGTVAQSEACPLGMQAVPSSIPTSGTFFHGECHENISTAILPLPLIQEEQLSVTGERMCTN